MTDDEARRLAEFIKDHDKRFEAKAADGVVRLTLAADGTELAPVAGVEDYRAAYIERDDPGPTVKAAWEKWGAALLA